MYQLCFSLPTRDRNQLRFSVEALVRALVAMNTLYLMQNPQTPGIYESGVVYVPDEDVGPEMQWWTIPTILEQGFADCKGLAAWRIAELGVFYDVPAEPLVTQFRHGRGAFQHVQVSTPMGTEDPSQILGM